jgi:pSer/pThr/pTyr-binding forkhead associated (FHA) protein
MPRQDREGWNDEKESDSSGFRSGAGGSTSSIFGGVYRENRGTEPWDGNSGSPQSGPKGGFYEESRKTTIPDTLQELYGILVVLSGPRRFDLLKIGQRKTTIGRDQTDIVLEDRAVGRQHAVITISGDDAQDAEFKIYDRGADGLPSRTGTLVNGKHVSEGVLRDKDHIQIGETKLLFVQLWPGF